MTILTDSPAPETPPADPTDETASAAVRVLQTTSKSLVLASLPDKIEYAQTLSNASLLPNEYRGREANVLYAIEVGAMLDLHPMAAISNIHIIKGKPTMSAALMQSQARKAGHRVRVWATVDERGFPVGHCQIIRCDDPEFDGFKTTFTLDDAARAELCKIRDGKIIARSDKGEALNWEKWPRSMVKHRAVSECVKDACPEALMGVMYTPDELGADTDEEGNLTAFPADSPEGAREARDAAFNAAQTNHDGEDITDAELVEPEEQRARLMAEMAEIAEILGMPFEQAMIPVASQVHPPDNNPKPNLEPGDVLQVLDQAPPDRIIQVLGPLRAAIANRLHAEGRFEEASAYIRAGATAILPVAELFGRPPLAPSPYPPQDTGPQDTAAPDAAPAAAGDADTESVGPHPFDSREDDPDSCAECNAKANEPIHDPLHGV